jgi:uroporphyrinogen decarboxylase
MTERQRIKEHIHFQAADNIPWQINCTSELSKKYMGWLGLAQQTCHVLGKNVYQFNALDDFLGNHITFLRNRPVNSVEEVEPGFFKDEWGVRWDRRIDKDIGNPGPPLLTKRRLDKLKVPDPRAPERYAHFQPIISANPGRYLLVKFSYSLFERAWSLRGMENLMIDFVEDPSFVHDLFRVITDFNLQVLKQLTRYTIDGAYFGDDWGGQRGLLMSPLMWRKYIKPYLAEMYGLAHEQGYDVFIHSCGNISLLLDDLIEIGLGVFNPFQPEVMDVEAIIKRYSGRLAFYGGMSIQRTLPFGSPEEVRKEALHRLKLARDYGGLIPSPSHDMPPDVPLENTLAMRDVFMSQ